MLLTKRKLFPHTVHRTSCSNMPKKHVAVASKVIIAGAGGAHLPGHGSLLNNTPVIIVPVKSRALCSILSVQMPGAPYTGPLFVQKTRPYGCEERARESAEESTNEQLKPLVSLVVANRWLSQLSTWACGYPPCKEIAHLLVCEVIIGTL